MRPLMLWASERGGPRERVDAVDQSLPAPHEYRVVPGSRYAAGGGHFAFVLCPLELAKQRPEFCSDAPGFDRVALHKQLNADGPAFFRVHVVNR
jgi:hypothetical protein